MTEKSVSPTNAYEPPRIAAKTSIEGALVGVLNSNISNSAAFRPL